MPPSIKLTKPAAPQFSISGRIKDPNERRIDSGVGPGKYVLKDGIGGRSSLSHRKTAASFKFMQGKRDGGIFQPDYAPGPGSYTLPRGIGTQSDSNLRTAPAIAMAGREKFGSLASLSETIGPGPGGGSLVKKGLQQLITQKQAPQAVFQGVDETLQARLVAKHRVLDPIKTLEEFLQNFTIFVASEDFVVGGRKYLHLA